MPSHLVGKGKPSPFTNSLGRPSDPNHILHRYFDSSLDLFLPWRSMDSSENRGSAKSTIEVALSLFTLFEHSEWRAVRQA